MTRPPDKLEVTLVVADLLHDSLLLLHLFLQRREVLPGGSLDGFVGPLGFLQPFLKLLELLAVLLQIVQGRVQLVLPGERLLVDLVVAWLEVVQPCTEEGFVLAFELAAELAEEGGEVIDVLADWLIMCDDVVTKYLCG